MPALIDRLLAEYVMTGRLPAISGGDNDPPAPDPTPDPPKPQPHEKPAGITDEIQEWVKSVVAKERDKAIKAEQDRIAADKEREAQERQRKADEEKGEFAKVRQSIERERDQFKTEAERIKGEYEAVAGLFDKQYQAALKDIPDDLKPFQPADDAGVLERVAFLDKLQTALKKRGTTTTTHGNGPNPKPGGKATTPQELRDEARRDPAYRVF